MNNVSNQQYAPQYGYEMPPTPPPVRSGDTPGPHANTPDSSADSTPPRPPMGPEQRGQFSSHSKIVNQPQPQGADATGQMAELTNKNKELHAKYDALLSKFDPMLRQLNQKIIDLTAHVDASEKNVKDAPVAPGPQPENRRGDDQNVAPPETPPQQNAPGTPPAPDPADTPVTEPGQSGSLEALTRVTSEFSSKLDGLLTKFNSIIETLTNTINNLVQRVNAMNIPDSQTPPEQADSPQTTPSDDVQPQTPIAPHNQPAEADEPSAPAADTAEKLSQENAKLEAQLTKMDGLFQDTISKLQQQVDNLTRQLQQKG
ncbi:hypothetical protein [Pseudomonas sp. ICMP 460]|uniref:hypothetical protein n=1 Tax=Pseudomonas sp. ICMP 460 TaxID=1718917 RepID=UPI000C06D1A3|nr:hypothetical protein [Pseudomonas sp. ICMP 460]PHN18512.1 hypothetical protein AO240_23555 [Pseudomonas sp. ICMP 460]